MTCAIDSVMGCKTNEKAMYEGKHLVNSCGLTGLYLTKLSKVVCHQHSAKTAAFSSFVLNAVKRNLTLEYKQPVLGTCTVQRTCCMR